MTIDANIVIAYLGGEAVVITELSQWRERGLPLFLSTVVETEVLSFSDWTPKEQHATEEFLEKNFASLPFDRPIARLAADIRRTVKIKFPDAAIAATALFTHTSSHSKCS
jgi:predicted nucleic acid-binding protein